MSGVIKSIGKAFKSVFNVVKKVALPVLAIGAVVLTGGAALGLLPAIGSLGASLGLSATLTGILSTAATSATIGAGVSLVTGGDPIKGATTGFIAGAALGGIGALAGGAGGAAGAASAAGAAPATSAANGAISMTSNAASLAAPVAASAPSGIGAVANGVLNFANKNPVIAAGAIQGIGQGISASAQAGEVRRQRQQVSDNYHDVGSSLYGGGGVATPALNAPSGRLAYDANTGRIVQVGN